LKSFRVHASAPKTNGAIPYLVLSQVGGRITLDFAALAKTTQPVAPLTISSDALYEILEGKDLVLRRSSDTVTLSPQADELLIVCESYDGGSDRQFRVWLSEVGLGWNILGGSTAHFA
jgi:hypothetical protein